MIRLLKWLFVGDSHLHKWKILESGKITRPDGRIVGTTYTLQCEFCGNIKTENYYI